MFCLQGVTRVIHVALYVSALNTLQATVAHSSLTVSTLIYLNIQKGEVIRSCVSDSVSLRAVLHLGAEQYSRCPFPVSDKPMPEEIYTHMYTPLNSHLLFIRMYSTLSIVKHVKKRLMEHVVAGQTVYLSSPCLCALW